VVAFFPGLYAVFFHAVPDSGTLPNILARAKNFKGLLVQ
jgi:hypothetical protein